MRTFQDPVLRRRDREGKVSHPKRPKEPLGPSPACLPEGTAERILDELREERDLTPQGS